MKNSAANLEEMPINKQVQKYTPLYTHSSFQTNVAGAVIRRQHCVRFDQPEI